MKLTGKWAVLSVISLGALMTTIDGSIVNIALPSIANAYGQPLNGRVQWTVIVYLLVLASTLLAFGKLSDTYGSKRIWTRGIVAFTLGSVACGFAPSLNLLIFFRALQAVGASMMLAPSTALIAKTFTNNDRGRALGINAVVVSIGVSAGPILGGYITQYLSWHWIFFINLPLGVLTYFWTLRVLPTPAAAVPSPTPAPRFDYLGGGLLALGLAGLTLALSFGAEWGWSSPAIIGAGGLGSLALAGAYAVERRAANPLLKLDLFRNQTFTFSFLSLLFSSAAIVSIGLLLPFYYEQLRGFSTATSGLMLAPMSIALGLTGPFAGALSDKVGSKYLVPLGLVLITGSMLLLGGISATATTGYLVVILVISGVGRALFFPANTNTLMTSTPAADQSSASSVLSTGRMVGQAMGIALAGAVFGGLGGAVAGESLEHGAATPALRQTFLHAFHVAMLVSGGVGGLGVVTSLLRHRPRSGRPNHRVVQAMKHPGEL